MVRNIGPGTPCRWYPFPRDNGNNAEKRGRRAAHATLKGEPGGWKKAVRRIDAERRAALERG
jgi:hypothetical protein